MVDAGDCLPDPVPVHFRVAFANVNGVMSESAARACSSVRPALAGGPYGQDEGKAVVAWMGANGTPWELTCG